MALFIPREKIWKLRDRHWRAHHALPECGGIADNYGAVLQQSGRLVEAIDTWKKAKSHTPPDAAVWVNLALATQQLGDAPSPWRFPGAC